MVKVLLAPTEDFIKRERTKVASDILAGSNVVIPVQNSAGYAVGDFIVVGIEGSELAELTKITVISGQNVTVNLLKLAHKADEPIIKYRFDKRKFYGSLTSDGSYTELSSSGSPADILVGDPQGTWLEYTGLDGYLYFKSTYYNSVTLEETDIADATPVLADENSRYCSIYAIRKQAGLTNNPYVTDGLVETYRKRAEGEVNTFLYQRYVLPLVNSLGVIEIPAILENCTVLLAAGYMDYQEFGKDGEGVKWLGEARSMLEKIGAGDLRIIDSTFLEFTEKNLTSGVRSFPDQVDNTNGPDQKFSMRQEF